MKLRNMINSPLFTGGRVQRYTGLHLVEPESLSDHTYESVLLCLIIIKRLEKDGIYHLDKGLLLEKALLHDLDESMTGDIPRPVKYADPDLKPALDKISRRYVEYLTKPFGIDISSDFENCKDKTPEGLVLKVVDLILVARKSIRELELKGNQEFYTVVGEVRGYLKEARKVIIDSQESETSRESGELVRFLVNLVTDSIETCEEVQSRVPHRKEYSLDRISL